MLSNNVPEPDKDQQFTTNSVFFSEFNSHLREFKMPLQGENQLTNNISTPNSILNKTVIPESSN